VARFSFRAPLLNGGCAGKGDWRWVHRGGGSARRCPRRREGRRRLRLAPGAAGEDEGGEGGSKIENGGRLAGSHRVGGGGWRSKTRR
jgi:hypothetical protein